MKAYNEGQEPSKHGDNAGFLAECVMYRMLNHFVDESGQPTVETDGVFSRNDLNGFLEVTINGVTRQVTYDLLLSGVCEAFRATRDVYDALAGGEK